MRGVKKGMKNAAKPPEARREVDKSEKRERHNKRFQATSKGARLKYIKI